ncbi:hypothetical protein FLAT13_00104 [Flavobacterium salmonis]|uniref:Uncharacterized protein n=1 Tax=Flavobacterium salmonis TaxID=2654844 RepID=A0A6V6YMP8_9FLAO|nr:hypothetical protein FLAT13_00104 [Flavobacterium salmonis]
MLTVKDLKTSTINIFILFVFKRNEIAFNKIDLKSKYYNLAGSTHLKI